MQEQARQGFFIDAALATGKLTTTWQDEWQLCTINAAICSLDKKQARGLRFEKANKQTKNPFVTVY